MAAPDSASARSALRWLGTFAACAAVYFVVLEAFLALPEFNGSTQIRPASGLGPVLGLFFGMPGILGSVLGNLVSDALRESDPVVLLQYAAVQFVYDALPRAVWRRAFPNDARPELSSASRIMAYLLIAVVDALVVTLLLVPFEHDTMAALNIHAVRFLNNFLGLMYVGVPVLLALGFALRPRGQVTPLGQRAALIMLCVSACASSIFLAAFVGQQAGVDLSMDRFDELVAVVYVALSAVTFVLLSAACGVLRLVERKLIAPLDEFAIDARGFPERFSELGPEAVAAGGLDVDLSADKPLPEISDLVATSNGMRRELARSVLGSQQAARERERVAAELDVAAAIQQASLPRDFSALEAAYAVSLGAVMTPAREVGGDFSDCFPLDADRLCVLAADVSDKGMPAALFMMRAMTEIRESIRSHASIGKAFSAANDRLCEHNDSMLFVTVFAVVLDARTGELEYANAGHTPPWRFGTIGEDGWFHVPAALPLGALEGVPYRSGVRHLDFGEGIVLYTDGVTEARNAAGELFGQERTERVFARACGDAAAPGAKEPCQAVAAAIEAYSEGAEPADDVTVCSIEWLPGARFLSVEPEVSELPGVQAFVRACAEALAELDAATSCALDLVVEELFVNIAEHAYPDGWERAAVRVLCACDEARGLLHLAFKDEGVPYDPTTRDVSPVSGDGMDLTPGGLGVLLVRKYTDGIWYRRENGTNVLHVVKCLVEPVSPEEGTPA